MDGIKEHRDVLSESIGKSPGPHGKYLQRVVAIWRWISERISLCILKPFGLNGVKGSLTVEAALVIPLFWYAISGFLYILLLFRLQEDVSQALSDAGQKFGTYVYGLELETNSDWSEAGLWVVEEELRKHCLDTAALRLVEGGIEGICLGQSEILETDARIHWIASYEVRLPFFFLGLGSIQLEQRQLCRAWIGYTGMAGDELGKRAVYITQYGSRYHESMECSYLKLSVRAIEWEHLEQLRNESGERYVACQSCCKGAADNLVYITSYGNRYHETLNCIGINRTIWMVLPSEVGDRLPCQGCQGRS